MRVLSDVSLDMGTTDNQKAGSNYEYRIIIDISIYIATQTCVDTAGENQYGSATGFDANDQAVRMS